MPLGFNPAEAQGLEAEIQFDLSGEGGGKMVLSISEDQCRFREGEVPSPALTIRSPGDIWMKMARGEIDRPKALMEGLYRVEGDMNLLMMMDKLFLPPTKTKEEGATEKRKEKMLKILALQGSPRPRRATPMSFSGNF